MTAEKKILGVITITVFQRRDAFNERDELLLDYHWSDRDMSSGGPGGFPSVEECFAALREKIESWHRKGGK